MKHGLKYYLSYFFLLCSLFSFAQAPKVDMVNLSLTDAGFSDIYLDVDNKISAIGLVTTDSLKMELSNGAAVQDSVEKNIFHVKANTFGINMITLYQNGQMLLKKEFTNAPSNKPKARLATLADTVMATSQIFTDPSLSIFIPNCDYDFGVNVSSFKVTFKRKIGTTLKAYDVKGSKMTGEHLLVIKQLVPGDKIIFTDIKVTCPQCAALKIKTLTITIK